MICVKHKNSSGTQKKTCEMTNGKQRKKWGKKIRFNIFEIKGTGRREVINQTVERKDFLD